VKVIIAGSKDFTLKDFLFQECLEIIAKKQYDLEIPLVDVEILTPHNPSGADYYGEKFSKHYNIKIKTFPANWNDITTPPVIIKEGFYGSYNSLAGNNRNEEMLNYATKKDVAVLVLFSVDKSPETKHLLLLAKKYGIEIFHYKFEKDNSGKLVRKEDKRANSNRRKDN
jgi:hypothetical protein